MPDIELRGPKLDSITDRPTSLTWGKYDDRRMPWVGRFGGDRVVSVGAASVLIARTNTNRVWLALTNDGAATVYLNLGETALANSSLRLDAGAVVVFDRDSMPWAGEVYGICPGGPVNVLVCDVSQNVIEGRGE